MRRAWSLTFIFFIYMELGCWQRPRPSKGEDVASTKPFDKIEPAEVPLPDFQYCLNLESEDCHVKFGNNSALIPGYQLGAAGLKIKIENLSRNVLPANLIILGVSPVFAISILLDNNTTSNAEVKTISKLAIKPETPKSHFYVLLENGNNRFVFDSSNFRFQPGFLIFSYTSVPYRLRLVTWAGSMEALLSALGEGYSEHPSNGTPQSGTDDGKLVIFLTSRKFSANLGGLLGADAKCSESAKLAGLAGNFIALLSGEGISAKDRIGTGQIVLNNIEETLIGDRDSIFNLSFSEMSSPLLPHLIDYDEFQNQVADVAEIKSWTGSDEKGKIEAVFNNCENWTRNTYESVADSVITGWPGTTSATWISHSGPQSNCNFSHHLYCIETNE